MKGARVAVFLLALVLLLLTAGTVGFHLIEGWPWFQSFYTTLMTVSTIGAQPESELSRAGQEFNVFLIFFGIAVVGFAIGSLTEAVIEFELGSFFGRGRMEKEISRMKDHVIICGAGRVGRKIASEVASRRFPVLLIEREQTKANWAQEAGIPVIIGDATSEAVLRQARIEAARGLASAVTTDAQNVYIVLTARAVSPDLFIVARASEEDAEAKLLRAGASSVISPYSFAGQRMARLLTRPNVQRFLDLAMSSLSDSGLDLQIEEVKVGQSSTLAGLTLQEADSRHQIGVVVLAIRHSNGELEFNPKANRPISADDHLIVMGDSKQLKGLETLAGV